MSIKGLNELNQALKDFIEDTKMRTVTVLKKVGLDMITSLSYYTPVDTGRARANWNMDVNATPTEVTPKEKRTKKISTGAGNAITKENKRKAKEAMTGVKVGDALHIANNVEYISYLNDGTERIAPFAMVEKSMEDVKHGITKEE